MKGGEGAETGLGVSAHGKKVGRPAPHYENGKRQPVRTGADGGRRRPPFYYQSSLKSSVSSSSSMLSMSSSMASSRKLAIIE